MKKLPIGLQGFKKIIEDDYLYVDKTRQIFDLISQGSLYFLSRPRRFGKSLLLSTIKEIFKGNKDLFKGLYIHDRWDFAEKHPVIKLSFSGDLRSSKSIRKHISNLLKLNLEKFDITYDDLEDFSGCFSYLIRKTCEKYNQRVVVLVDEYDKAIGIASRATEATSVPRHKGTFPGGGTDYREKVTYLNEAIPGNSVGMRIDSSHFNEPNAVTFVRYDTRGVDNYGDTYFMVELQSDPHQSITKSASSHYKKFKKGEYEFSPVDMVRKNPNSKAIRTRVIKREIDDLLTRQNEIQKNAMERPLAPPEIDELDSIMKSIKTKERDLNRMPATLGEASSTQIQRGSTYDIDNKSYDFFPMGNESTWVKANIKGLINDARKNNKRYIALAPADFFQLTVNNKAKIEQFYGLGNKRLGDEFINVDSMKNFNNADGSGFGKYRKYKKADADDAYSDSLPTEELGGMAVVPKAMKDVAKELGATFTTKKVFHTDQNKLYKIYDNSKKVPAYAFSKKYQMEEFFANLDRKSGLEMMKMETDDPRNFVESIVIDLQGTNKKAKMKAYKFGGFVQVDRSNFAPLF